MDENEDLAGASQEQEALAREAAEGRGEGEGEEQQHHPGEEGEGQARARPPRPGKLERQLARRDAEVQELRQREAFFAQQAQQLARQLAEAQEAGNRIAADGLKTRIGAAEDMLQRAIDSGDTAAAVKANRALAELVATERMVMAEAQRRPAQPQREVPQQQPAPSYTPTTAAWLEANSWYGRDAELTGVAKAAHAATRRQGIAPDTPEYWAAIERAVEAVAPGTVAGAEDGEAAPAPAAQARRPSGQFAPRAATPVTRSATRSPNAPRGEVQLTPEEADAAKVSGMSPQEYKSWQTKLRASGRLNAGAR